jgi:tetraacyldisaccharide 4'-kinase
MPAAIARILQRHWWRPRLTPLTALLAPLAFVVGAVAARRRASARAQPLPVPVIVVGNVIVGGAGKTPSVIALVALLRSWGYAPGIVSRGHGRADARALLLDATTPRDAATAVAFGDEPLLMHRRTGAPIAVARRRRDAAVALLRTHPEVDVIVADDGLQHHALARDIEICVFDARGVGNGWLLPAGPLREPWPRPVDLVLQHGQPAGLPGYAMERTLATHARRADGSMIALADLRGTPVHALAGIAQPEAFFAMLRASGLSLAETHAFPDHHDFAGLAGVPAEVPLLCTEKDAVKLWRIRPDAWAVPLEVRIPPAFWQDFDRLLDARLSSLHGSSPA